MSGRYIRQEPYVDDHGIYTPVHEYVPEGCASMYQRIMTKEMFVEAYNKWIKNNNDDQHSCFDGQDSADDWCE